MTKLILSGVPKRLLLLGGVLAVLGVLAIVTPLVAAVFAETMLAICVLLAGIAHIVHSLQSHGWRLGEMIWGVMLGLGGIVLFAFPMEGVVTMTLVLAVSVTLEGVAKILTGIRFVPTHHRLCFILDGVFGVVIGLLIWMNWPGDSTWVIGTLVGLRLLAAGVSSMFLSNAVKSAME